MVRDTYSMKYSELSEKSAAAKENIPTLPEGSSCPSICSSLKTVIIRASWAPNSVSVS